MATVRGRSEVQRFLAALPGQLEAKLLRGAARAAATVVADDAKTRLGGRHAVVSGDTKVLIADAIKVVTKNEPGRVIAKVQVKGPGAYVAPWLEYGTAPHFISVDDAQREGRSVNRINRLEKEGSLVIGGKFVGKTVHHPGARPHPFLRPALDTKRAEAIRAAQEHINARIGHNGGPLLADEGDET